jgi:hypothetical protein
MKDCERVAEYVKLLAKGILEQRAGILGAEAKIRQRRTDLLNSPSDDVRNMAVALDHIFRVVFLPLQTPFSVTACGDADVDYYRVVLDEQGEIVHNSGQLIAAAGAIQLATSWYYLLAWPGTTVTLLASLRNGQIIKCAMHKVRP